MRIVKRGEYDEEVVRWADTIISAGGRDFRWSGFAGPKRLFLEHQLLCPGMMKRTRTLTYLTQGRKCHMNKGLKYKTSSLTALCFVRGRDNAACCQ